MVNLTQVLTMECVQSNGKSHLGSTCSSCRTDTKALPLKAAEFSVVQITISTFPTAQLLPICFFFFKSEYLIVDLIGRVKVAQVTIIAKEAQQVKFLGFTFKKLKNYIVANSQNIDLLVLICCTTQKVKKHYLKQFKLLIKNFICQE